MRLKNCLIVVRDLEVSRKFYKELFGLDTVLDGMENVILTEGLVLQGAESWEKALGKKVVFENNASELYFEERDIEGFLKKLSSVAYPVHMVTPLKEIGGGKRVVRFYDPDGNLIEVGTP